MGRRHEPQAPDEDVWGQGLRWIEAARMQADRFEDAFYAWNRALLDAEMRARLAADTEHARTGRASDDEHVLYDPQRPIQVPSHALHMQWSSEAAFLLFAARNVMRSQERLPAEARTAMGDQEIVKALRDISEHFDESDGPSARTLASDFPDVQPGALAYKNKEIWLGGLDGVPLSRIRAWLARVRAALVDALEGAGQSVPHDLLASTVEGDDDLAWPPERLHYGWWIPQVSEEDWPREELPEHVAGLLAERFMRLRARDSRD